MYGTGLSTAVAKKEFFLDKEDLLRMPYETGGWAAGRLRVYDRHHLKILAESKFGKEGLAAKQADQQKRLEKKRKREEDATEAVAAAASLTS